MLAASQGGRVAWVVPTYKNGRPLWRWAENTCAPLRKAGLCEINRSERTIVFKGGGFVGIYSMDNEDSIRGEAFHVVIVDEAAKIPETAWTDAIQPTLADYAGDAILISTPRGQNWFWREWVRGSDKDVSDAMAFTAPTSDNPNPNIKRAAALARERVPDRAYRQEWLAEFIEDGGGVFRKVRDAIEKGYGSKEPHKVEPVEGQTYSMGVDLARVEDFTVIDVVNSGGRQVYHERFNQISWERQIEAIKRVAGHYKAAVVMDSTGVGDPVYEQVRKAGVRVTPFQFTNSSKEQLIDNLAMRIEQGEARLMDIDVQTNELLAYQYELTPSRNVRMNAPSGCHDDCVIGLALAYWGVGKRITMEMAG